MLDPAVRRLLDDLATLQEEPPPDQTSPVLRRRWAVRHRTAWLAGPQDNSVSRQDLTAPGGVPSRLYSPKSSGRDDRGLVVFAHGGGWVTGDLETHDSMCAMLCRLSGWSVLAVDYRRAPEHRFPAALDDLVAVTKGVLTNGIAGWDVSALVIAGDSAGGNLAAVVAQQLRSEQDLRGQLLFYPILDASTDPASYSEFATGYTLDAAVMAWFWEQYAPGRALRSNPELSPVSAPDISGSPSALIISATHDVLRDEGAAYHERLRSAGVPSELVVFPGTVHGFARMTAVIPAARQALEVSANWLRNL